MDAVVDVQAGVFAGLLDMPHHFAHQAFAFKNRGSFGVQLDRLAPFDLFDIEFLGDDIAVERRQFRYDYAGRGWRTLTLASARWARPSTI